MYMRGRNPYLRFLGWLSAVALALQVAVPNAAAANLAACCCKHKEAHNCRCPVCEHQRELASNVPCMKSCGGSEQMATPAPLLAFEPPPALALAPLPLPDAVATPVAGRPDSPVIEVE